MSRKDVPREELVAKALVARCFKEQTVSDYLAGMEAALWQEWQQTTTTELREEVYWKAWGLTKFRQYVEMVIIDGNHAQNELNSKVEKELKQKKKK